MRGTRSEHGKLYHIFIESILIETENIRAQRLCLPIMMTHQVQQRFLKPLTRSV